MKTQAFILNPPSVSLTARYALQSPHLLFARVETAVAVFSFICAFVSAYSDPDIGCGSWAHGVGNTVPLRKRDSVAI